MYLKSLVLKGFKSFADRSVISLEPGITAVVGPNGSGKSNISDAVLWVLGERNAKNLRGQAMEDVIFAGSSARKSVSVAEVDLVLDNSDGTLPVEFDEVALTRRMYRSGESEYLINGSPARRMDFMDILHDTGLGTGTHSIISQGNLDAILASKPEDRRALIEEAAGVLKHKQRKERSARKLAAMDTHLARVKDVTAEVERQLKPLARKAQRAQTYQGLADHLAELDLTLAVDDLRQLQAKWDDALLKEKEAAAAIDVAKLNMDESAAKLEKLQLLLQEKGLYVGDLTAQRGRFHMVVERFDSAELLLAEKARSIRSRLTQAEDTMMGSARRISHLEEDASALEEELSSQKALRDTLESRTEEAARELKELSAHRAELDAGVSGAQKELRICERSLADSQAKIARLKDSASGQTAKQHMLESRIAELSDEVQALSTEFDEKCKGLDEQAAALEELSRAAQQATADADAAQRALREAEERLSQAKAEKRSIEGQISALEQLNRKLRATNQAAVWIECNGGSYDESITALSTMVKAPEELEGLVELLLGDDVAAMFVHDRASAELLAQDLRGAESHGRASVMFAGAAAAPAIDIPEQYENARLIGKLTYPAEAQSVLEALLGDVILAESDSSAYEIARALAGRRVRVVTPHGLCIWPDAKISVSLSPEDGSQGMLARERALEELSHQLKQAQTNVQKAEHAKEESSAAADRKRALSLELSQSRAQKQGDHTSAEAERQRLATRLGSCRANLDASKRDLEDVLKRLSQTEPEMEQLRNLIDDLAEERAALDERISSLSAQRLQAYDSEQTARQAANDDKLALATCTERVRSLDRQLRDRTNDIERAKRARQRAEAESRTLSVAAKRIEPLRELIESCKQSAQVWVDDLAGRAALEQSNSAELNAAINDARAASRNAQDAHEGAVSALNEVRVVKGRLEVQVENAVKAIVDECGVPLETALQVPAPENRAELAAEADKLRRRIANMGTIDASAADEYAAMKERYDFMMSQIEDVEAARRALKRIVGAIDERMKHQFDATFEAVNANFKEIFGTLFPGGEASLELVNPDDPDHLGVEVNAQPRGKKITKMMLMSGGEKSLTALALLFAVYRIRSTPFYILDEVEAALDDSNLRRLTAYLQTLRTQTQLIMITHQRRTMEMADVLYGVSMQADGVTKVISQKLDQAAPPK